MYREFLEDMARGKTMSGFNMEGVMKYYNTGDNITYWARQTGKVAVAVGGYIVYMTPSEVFQRWGSVYGDKEKREFLEDMARGKTMSWI